MRRIVKKLFALILCLALMPPQAFVSASADTCTSDYTSVAELKAAGLLKAQEVEEEGIVLLKNENSALPLAEGTPVSLFGVTAVDPVYSGTGSGSVDISNAANFIDAFIGAGLSATTIGLITWYNEQHQEENIGRSRYTIGEARWNRVSHHLGEDYGEVRGTSAFVVLGRVGGEGDDMTQGALKEDAGKDGTDYLTLNAEEESLLSGLRELKDTGVIRTITVIINSANPLSAAFLFDDAYGIDAALWVGSLGQTGIHAVGRVITGAVNPSGCLPDTWWMDNMDNPVMRNFGAQTYADAETWFPDRSFFEYTRYVAYQEGIYLGYRYTETRFADTEQLREGAGDFNYNTAVAFPFGFGLSYTSFTLSDMAVRQEKEAYTVSVTITNTGNRAGKKTVQIYAAKPYTDYDAENGIEKAAVELVGFGKSALLPPGASQQLSICVPEYFLTSYDAENTEVFILDEGCYRLICADNAHDAVLHALSAEDAEENAPLAPSAKDPLVWIFWQTFNSETYAASYGTGEPVVSLFSMADINRYDGAGDNQIMYYSRGDWTQTVTEESVRFHMTDLIAADLVLTDDDLPFDEDEFPLMGVDAGLLLSDMMDVDFDNPLWDTFMDQLTFEELELLCMTGLRETAALERIGKPCTVDHNGPTGVTQRYSAHPEGRGLAVLLNDPDSGLSGTCYPCNGILAATFNQPLIEEVGVLVGEDALWAGYSGIYGTGLNLHRSPYAGRLFEYFSEDSLLSGLMGAALSRGVQSKGIYVYSKPLVLNEQEENRAGLSTWCNEQSLRELYLRPFELAVIDGGALCVMSAFNRLGPIWCGASHELLTDWLRSEVGMHGFVVTDMHDTSYMDPANFLTAGNDLPDGEPLKNGYTLAPYTENGETPSADVLYAMRLSVKRILYIVLHSRATQE